MVKLWKVGLLGSLLTLGAAALPPIKEPRAVQAAMPVFDGSLSVLTYNVKGLPWPIAWNRAEALERIASRLRASHTLRRAPQVIVMPEEFTAEAHTTVAAPGQPERRCGGKKDG